MHQFLTNHQGSIVLCACVRTGMMYDPPHQYQLSHLLEHLLFRQLTSENALQMEANGITYDDMTVYYIQGPASQAKTLVQLFHKLMHRPTLAFLEKNLDLERATLLEEDHVRNMMEVIRERSARDLLFGKTLYSTKHDALASSLKKISAKDLLKAYDHYYQNMTFVMHVPRAQRGTVDRAMRKAFGSLYDAVWPSEQTHYVLEHTMRAHEDVHPTLHVKIHSLPHSDAAHVMVSTAGFAFGDPDDGVFRFATLLLRQRLTIALRRRSGYVYGVACGYDAMNYIGTLTTTFQTTAVSELEEMVTRIRAVYHALCQEPIAQKELDLLKQKFWRILKEKRTLVNQCLECISPTIYRGQSCKLLDEKIIRSWTPMRVHQAMLRLLKWSKTVVIMHAPLKGIPSWQRKLERLWN